MPATEMNAFLDGILERKRRHAMKTILELEEDIAKLEREISLLEKASRGYNKSSTLAVVSGVSWLPFYDLRATSTAEGKTSSSIKLHYSASISQMTGEDWTDAALTLCTASSQTLQSLTVPAAEALKLVEKSQSRQVSSYDESRHEARGRYRSAVSPPLRRERIAGGYSRSSSSIRGGSDVSPCRTSVATPEAALPAGQATAVDRNPVVLFYRIDGRVSLPSDGLAHKITIAVLDFSGTLKYVCVPRKGPSAYIEASIKNTSDYELLPGPVSVFMDDGFVTKTSLKHVSVDESFDCVLGVDTALKVSCERKSRTDQEPARNFAERTKTTTQTVLTTLTNGHKVDVTDVVVCAAIALGNDDLKVKVALQKPEGLARANDGEEVRMAKAERKMAFMSGIAVYKRGRRSFSKKGPAHMQWEKKENQKLEID
ncbi:hypothetical protein C8T65DRAFT_746360 [Cerioporus squamosus]|nr:hypothetical protein C8T65DRAFT_746360 [Cerioporus squamosus]